MRVSFAQRGILHLKSNGKNLLKVTFSFDQQCHASLDKPGCYCMLGKIQIIVFKKGGINAAEWNKNTFTTKISYWAEMGTRVIVPAGPH